MSGIHQVSFEGQPRFTFLQIKGRVKRWRGILHRIEIQVGHRGLFAIEVLANVKLSECIWGTQMLDRHVVIGKRTDMELDDTVPRQRHV